MSNNSIKKISKAKFDETFEILFGEEQTVGAGTPEVMANVKQALIKDRATGEISKTNIFTQDEEYGKSLVIDSYCLDE